MNELKESKLTAYALNELDARERAEVEAWIAQDPEARRLLAELQATAALLRADLAHEQPIGLTALQRERISAGPAPRPRRARVLVGAGVLALAAAGIALVATSTGREAPSRPGGPSAPSAASAVPPSQPDAPQPAKGEERPPVPAEPAPAATPRLATGPDAEAFTQHIASWFEGRGEHRLHVQLDRPLYRPGETVWVKTWDVAVRDLSGQGAAPALAYQLLDPRGAVVVQKQVQAVAGRANNDLIVPPGAPGGEYVVRAVSALGTQGERKLIVASYQPPRIKKKLELLRKAYGPGDEVVGALELLRPTGEPLAAHGVSAVVRLDGVELPRVSAVTDQSGGAVVRFTLPDHIALGDGLVTVLVDDGGVTESLSKRIPIVLDKLQLSFFPEGGDLVSGLESRVYFAAKNMLGKPADMRGRIVDDHGVTVAEIASLKQGMGRFTLLPASGRRYFAEVTQPVGVSQRYALPLAREAGCVLRSYDDFDGAERALRVGVRCSAEREVTVLATQRERLVDHATVAAGPRAEALVYLASRDEALALAQGVARVTVFGAPDEPLAERIVYRNRRSRLSISVEPDRERYQPRDQVSLAILAKDAAGRPVEAELAMAVVDDTVVSHADDKSGHIMSRLLLEPEVVGEVEEPNVYFDLREADSGPALDLLLGTQGWRRFEWRVPRAQPVSVVSGVGAAALPPDANVERALLAKAGKAGWDLDLGAARPRAGAELLPGDGTQAEPASVLALGDNEAEARGRKGELAAVVGDLPLDLRGAAANDRANFWQGVEADAPAQPGAAAQQPLAQAFAAVRVFPIPSYTPGYDGPRNDFRDTVLWAPSVRTDAAGRALVRFTLSDAVTSFRAVAEGIGGGAVGRSETVIASSRPFSMNVKLPAAVTSRDAPRLPLTLTNDTAEALTVEVRADLGERLALVDAAQATRRVELAPHARTTIYFAARPAARGGTSKVAFSASARGLRDAFEQELAVEPAGFPLELAASGELAARARHQLDLGDALPGSVEATLKLYPSPVATMLGGLEGVLAEPNGCFEQASATNYPNVMVMDYLRTHEVDDAALLTRSRRLLESGYARLTGYETNQRGYEWFGRAPGHEALTAYGLVQFKDMQAVYGAVDEDMIARSARWLASRRDGKGGFLRNAQALDSFGQASAEVTDAYISWSLSEAGWPDLAAEVAAQAERAERTSDAYLLALASNTLLNAGQREAAARALTRLVALQDESGAWTKADHSITRSGGVNLAIETTALAALALVKEGAHASELDRAVRWLQTTRGGDGGFGTTQATILALKALTRYADARRVTRGAGKVSVLVDGVAVGELSYQAGQRGPLELAGLGEHLAVGVHSVELVHDGGEALPYTLAVSSRTLRPASAAKAAVTLATRLERSALALGETVRATATVRNTSARGQPMTLARVGIPGGLTFQTWQLKELRDKGLIAFYETTPREVILYFDGLAPSAVVEVPLDLVASVPGAYRAAASSGYLYYTDDLKSWVDGLEVTVSE